MWEEREWIESHLDVDEIRNQEMMTLFAAEEGGVLYNEEEVAALARVEEPPDLLASLLQELGGVAEFGPIVEEESVLVQEESLYSLTSSSNCDLFLNMVTEDPEVTLSSFPPSSDPVELFFQPSSGSPLSSVEAECSSNGKNKTTFDNPPSQKTESHPSPAPVESVRLKPATTAPKCQCSMHMLVGYPPSQVMHWTVVLAQSTPIFASPGICLLFLRGYLKCLQAFISSNSQEEEVGVSLCHSCVSWADRQVEVDLGVVEEARERGLLGEEQVELEEDLAEERPVGGMCRDLILEALSRSLGERFANFEMCREIIIEEMNKRLTTHVEGSGQQLKEVVRRPDMGVAERSRSPNVGSGMKPKWKGQSESSKEPSRKRGRRAKETLERGDFSEERRPKRRRSQRVSNNGGPANSLVEETVCKNAVLSDNDVSTMMKKDVNHNTELSDKRMSQEYRSSVQTLKSPFYIQCPACTHNVADAVQFEKHVDSEHGTRVGRLRTATKCCCSLHSHVCRAFAGSLLRKENKHRLVRGVGGMGRPDTPEEKRARAALFRHQLLLNMNHNLLCSLCIRFANSHLIDAREEEGGVVAEKREPAIGETSQECHKEEENRRDGEFSWEFGRALEVQVERLTEKQLKGWSVFLKDAIMPSTLESTSVNETDRMVMVGDTCIVDEQRSDTSENDACEEGQRLKQLLVMEANLRKLLDQGDLVEEERESLARLNRLIQELPTPR